METTENQNEGRAIMKKIVFFYGEKGGVGKSQALLWVAENLLKNKINVLIIEADRIEDIHLRYETLGISKYSPLAIPKDGEESGINRVFDNLLENTNEIVLVNLPPAAAIKIEPLAGDFVSALHDMGYEVSVIFVADDKNHSLRTYEKTMNKGFMSKADKKIMIHNLLFGNFPESWPIKNIKQPPDFIIPMKEVEPYINDIIMAEYDKPVFDIINNRLNAFQSVMIKSWIDEAAPLVQFIKE